MTEPFIINSRFSDEDSQQHIHHEAMVGYIAAARVNFIDGALKESGVENIDYVLVHLAVDFIGEVNFPGAVAIDVKVSKIGSTSVSSEYNLAMKGEVFAKALCVNVFFKKETGEKTPIPDSLRAVLER